MARSYASAVIAAPADEVWALVRRFDGLPDWHPAVQSVEMVDGAHPQAVGAERRQVLSSGGTARARLSALDADQRSIRYEMLDGPFPVRSYHSTIRVTPITATGESFVEWWGTYDADAAVEQQLTAAFGRDVYEAGLAALAAQFPRASPSS